MLGRSLDELPPRTRTLLQEIHRMVHAECERQGIAQRNYRFSRKTIRAFTQWSDGQLKIHCRRLEDLEYLLVHRGGRGRSLEYELLYSGAGDSGQAQLMGLLDVGQLQKKPAYDAQKSGAKLDKTDPSQAQVRLQSAAEHSRQATADGAYRENRQAGRPNAYSVA
jgi:hypothetical protein